MNEEELEDWVNDNPMIANAVYPACIVLESYTSSCYHTVN